MSEPLRLSSIEAKKKIVEIPRNYMVTIPETPSIARDLVLIDKCIRNGTPIPDRFYRRERDSTPDEALEIHGLMHLHVGDDRKDLLFLYQYENAVILVALTDHSPFKEIPSGKTIHNITYGTASLWAKQYAAKLVADNEKKRAAIALGIKPRNPTS